MNTIRKKLQQKIGDTTQQQQRVEFRVKQRLMKKKQFNFKWLGSIAIGAVGLVILFLILPNQNSQQQTAVEIGGVMFDEKTSQEKPISDLLYEEVQTALHVTKKEKLFYTAARYTDYDYVTTHCKTGDCRILALQDNGKSGAIYNLGKGHIEAEILSPDEKIVLLVLHTKKQDTLRFMYTNTIHDHPEVSKYFPKIKTAKWLSNEKIQLTFLSGQMKIITIPRYYK